MESAIPIRRDADSAKALLLEIERRSRQSLANGQEPDLTAIAAMIDRAVSDPRSGAVVLVGLAKYLAGAVIGCVPDVTSWL